MHFRAQMRTVILHLKPIFNTSTLMIETKWFYFLSVHQLRQIPTLKRKLRWETGLLNTCQCAVRGGEDGLVGEVVLAQVGQLHQLVELVEVRVHESVFHGPGKLIKSMGGNMVEWPRSTRWSIWSRNTVCWHQIKSAAPVRTSYTKAQLLLKCQQKVILYQMDNPVLKL